MGRGGVKLHELPNCKGGLPTSPRFIVRTERVDYGRSGKWKAMWECKCGNKFESFVDNVVRRHTTSCGCEQDRARHLAFPIHGHSTGDGRSPTYKSWQAMIARCTNPKHPAFHNYGGRGVTICRQWLISFPQFLADAGARPPGMTLDRVNPYGNYEPSNIRWADRATQSRNQRRYIADPRAPAIGRAA
jgi:hypothetical protein